MCVCVCVCRCRSPMTRSECCSRSYSSPTMSRDRKSSRTSKVRTNHFSLFCCHRLPPCVSAMGSGLPNSEPTCWLCLATSSCAPGASWDGVGGPKDGLRSNLCMGLHPECAGGCFPNVGGLCCLTTVITLSLLTADMVMLSKSKYGRHLVKKLLMHG